MARDDVFQVRHESWPAMAESGADRAVMNKLGSIVVTDFYTQLALGGWAYVIQVGALSTAVAGTAALTALIGVGVVDNNAGYACLPLHCEMHIATYSTATLFLSMLEADMAKKRFSSGGTALTPRNLRGDSPRTFNGNAYNNTGTLVLAAASAAPHTVELGRGVGSEDAQPATTFTDRGPHFLWDVRRSGHPVVLVDAGSLVLHHGSTTATDTMYGNLQFAQLDKTMLV